MSMNRTWSRPPALLLALGLSAAGACGEDGKGDLTSTSQRDAAAAASTADHNGAQGSDAGRREGERDAGEAGRSEIDGGGGRTGSGGRGNGTSGSGTATPAGSDAGGADATTPSAEDAGVAAPEAATTQSDASEPLDGALADAGPAPSDAGSDTTPAADASQEPPPRGCDALILDAQCDKSARPIVFVHGTIGAGDNYGNPAQLFASNGYCPERIRAIDYDSIGSATPYESIQAELDRLIAELLESTGADKVDLVGHAAGANHAAVYVAANAARIAHDVHLGGDELSADPGEVPTLCVSSTGDAPVTCGTSENKIFEDTNLDQIAVAASLASFRETYAFLSGERPRFETVQCGGPITLEGRALTFGDNAVVAGGRIEVYELGMDARERGEPVRSFIVPGDGRIGPFEVKRDVAYEFKLIAPANDGRAPRHLYFPRFRRSDRLLRFFYESTHPDARRASEQVNYDDSHAVLVVRRRNSAFRAGRDRLTVNSFPVLNAENAGSDKITVGLYLFDRSLTEEDGPGDGASNGGVIFSGQFVSSSDVFLPAATPAFIEVNLTGQRLRVPNWPSKSDGLSLVMVD